MIPGFRPIKCLRKIERKQNTLIELRCSRKLCPQSQHPNIFSRQKLSAEIIKWWIGNQDKCICSSNRQVWLFCLFQKGCWNFGQLLWLKGPIRRELRENSNSPREMYRISAAHIELHQSFERKNRWEVWRVLKSPFCD